MLAVPTPPPPQPKGGQAHVFVKVHVVRHDVDVGVEHLHLPDNLLQDVTNARREDEKGNVVLVEGVEERLVSLPEKRWMDSAMALPLLLVFTSYLGDVFLNFSFSKIYLGRLCGSDG